MADVVGRLVALLGLDATEYTRGLTKAERQAQQFARNTRSAILEVGKVLGGLAIGNEILQATKAIIGEASALNDLADATGSSVESLSRLNNQAKIAGTDFSTLQAALLKLSEGMAGADEDSKRVKDTLRLLGVTTKDPAQALQEIALRLNTYADGVNKVGLAKALFNKQGAAFLATLKDIAELQDVGATVSAKQAAEAEELEKSYRRLSVESSAFRQSILSDVVPALNTLISTFNDARRASTSFGEGLTAALALVARSGTDAKRLEEVTASIATLQKQLSTKQTPFAGLNALQESLDQRLLSQLETERDVLRERLRRANRSQIEQDVAAVFGPKPEAPPPPPARDGKAFKAARDEAEAYIHSLRASIIAAQDLTEVERTLREMQDGRLENADHEQKDRALRYAQERDALNAAKKATEEQNRALAVMTREADRFADTLARSAEASRQEAQAIRDGTAHLEEQLVFLRGGQEALDALTDARREATIAQKEANAAALESLGFGDLATQIRDQNKALREQATILKDIRIAEVFKKEAEAMQEVKNMFSDIAGNAFADFISGTKSAKDAFRSFVDDIGRQLARIASQNIANAIFGGTNQGGPDVFAFLAKTIIPMLFGGGGGGGLNLSGFGPAFAATGGVHSGPTVVGERGPELLNLPPGTRVTPNSQLSKVGSSLTIHQTVNVMPGASTASARQAAARLRDVTMSAVRDR